MQISVDDELRARAKSLYILRNNVRSSLDQLCNQSNRTHPPSIEYFRKSTSVAASSEDACHDERNSVLKPRFTRRRWTAEAPLRLCVGVALLAGLMTSTALAQQARYRAVEYARLVDPGTISVVRDINN